MSLQNSIDAWQESLRAIIDLDLDEQQGRLETSLPGWRVRDILAHLVHIEEVTAFGEAPRDGGATAVTTAYTQAGVDELAETPVAELIERLQTALSTRLGQLTPPPADPAAPADRTPGGVTWNWQTLLNNRALDAWMHEQDIRRAIGREGGLDSLGLQLTVRSLASALPFIVGKRARIEEGQPVRFVIDDRVAIDRTITVGDDGRAADTDAEPHATISMSAETFTRLAGGREPLETFEVSIEGDREIAARVLANFAVTP